ncbi:MAG: restriction endonuclease [Victivallaceae bacterium]|nr:restriction endonuclease [Victivallaceae bacterium]
MQVDLMLFNCFKCSNLGFHKICPICGLDEQHENVPLKPQFYQEFQYESQGFMKDLFVKKRAKKGLQQKLDSVLSKYNQFETPYFINYMKLTGINGINSIDVDDFSNLSLFQNVLVRLGFDELLEFPQLAVKLIRTTSFRFQYNNFVQSIKRHILSNLNDSLCSWIEECGPAFKRELPMFSYYLWDNQQFVKQLGNIVTPISFEEFEETLDPNGSQIEPSDLLLKKIEKNCNDLYLNIAIERFKVTLEKFDLSLFVNIYLVDEMNGYEFEDFLSKLFSSLGYEVKTTARSNDQGADLFAEKFGRKIVIQAKNYTENVGNSAVQQVLSAKTFYKCDDAMVITNSYFTNSANKLAEAGNVRLIDRKGLKRYLDEYNQMIVDNAVREQV